MSTFFSFSPFVMFVLLFLFALVLYGISLLFLRYFARQASRDILTMPVVAFVGTIATAWALSLGFVAADIWTVNSKAAQTASEERSSIVRLIGMARPDALNAPDLLKALTTYRVQVVTDEWRNYANNQPSRLVEEELQHIRIALINLSQAGNISDPLMGKMISDFDELQDARNTRLAIGSSSVNHYKWYLVLFLTVVTLVVIAAVHADRSKAGRKALVIYLITAIMSVWILLIHASPYRGVAKLEPNILFTSQRGALTLPSAFQQ